MDIKELINQYTDWLKNEITFEKMGEYYEITTPYLDNTNDYLQLYVKQVNGDIYFTDDGATINNLEMSGFQLSANRKIHLNSIINQYGVELNGKEIIARAPISQFSQKKHMFVQALIRIDDMYSMSKTKVSSYFFDDVQSFFMDNNIYYSENVQFIGRSGFSHNYDFLLQRSRSHPERLCRAVNNPNKTNMGNIIFAWNDTKPSRRNDSRLIVFLNDQNTIAKGVEEAFLNYDASVVKWSDRFSEKNIDILSAS